MAQGPGGAGRRDAPSSITGSFLYAPPDYESEIDVELFNDPEGEVMFSTYARGAQTHTERRPARFDATAAMREYRFDYGPGSVMFLVDGVPLRTWTTGVPSAAMNVCQRLVPGLAGGDGADGAPRDARRLGRVPPALSDAKAPRRGRTSPALSGTLWPELAGEVLWLHRSLPSF